MSFSVTKMAPTLVSPSAPTPSGHLPFSAEDRMMPPSFLLSVVLVFRQGKKHMAAKVIREAVAKALVPYYPVAGRTAADPHDGELGIACTGEGVWFVEASADCRLESLGDVNLYVQEQNLFDLSKEQLLPCPPQHVDRNALPLTMQVTEFKCGGFTVGIIFNHAMFDGIGVGQFMVAIGEMARGLAEPTVKPVWCRDVVPRLCPGPDPNTEPLPKCQISYTTDLSLDRISQLKDKFEKETGERCTTFDIVLAIFWQCRTRAIDQQPDVDVCLTSSANVRGFLHDRLPPGGGYYGNCFNLILLKATAGQISNASIFDIVRLVREAKGNVGAQCSGWLKGVGGPPHMPPFTYPNVLLTDWRRLGFFEADYGWGAPDYVVPLDRHPATILNSPAPVKGIRLSTNCIAHQHIEAFRSHMSEWLIMKN